MHLTPIHSLVPCFLIHNCGRLEGPIQIWAVESRMKVLPESRMKVLPEGRRWCDTVDYANPL